MKLNGGCVVPLVTGSGGPNKFGQDAASYADPAVRFRRLWSDS